MRALLAVMLMALASGCAVLPQPEPAGPVQEVRVVGEQVYYLLDPVYAPVIEEAVARYAVLYPEHADVGAEVFVFDGWCWATPYALYCWLGEK